MPYISPENALGDTALGRDPLAGYHPGLSRDQGLSSPQVISVELDPDSSSRSIHCQSTLNARCKPGITEFRSLHSKR
jgi:hypothetical protein